MAEHVEKMLNDMVPELDDLRRKRIFDEDELRLVVKRRRDFEYTLQKSEVKQQDFLSCVRYEVALECLRTRRSKNLHWKRKTVSDYAGIKRLHNIFGRACSKFKGDMRMWYQYIDFCLRSGSTKILSRVLLRALKFHPREVHLWLLAADRELKMGHMKAARALLVQGLRFAPKSPKLWGEFLRLEVRVACHLLDVRDSPHAEAEGEGAAAHKSPWAPARLLFRRALSRLSGQPGGLAPFLVQACTSLREARTEPKAGESLEEWAAELRAALAEHRPGVPGGPQADGAPDEVVEQLWELWWIYEVNGGHAWPDLVEGVAAAAPATALRRFAGALRQAVARDDEGTSSAAEALLRLAATPSAAVDADTAVAVLQALEALAAAAPARPAGCTGLADRAFKKLLKLAVERHPECGRLALAAWEPSAASGPATKRRRLLAEDAAAMLLLHPRNGAAREVLLEEVLRGLAPEAAPGAAVAAELAAALACGGGSALQEACQGLRLVADKLWDVPRRRAAVLAATLDGELRYWSASALEAPGPQAAAARAQALCGHFEELLRTLKDEDPVKQDWWIRYMKFVHMVSTGSAAVGVPSIMDLHWRAMRSVADQARYTEQAQQLLQQAPAASG